MVVSAAQSQLDPAARGLVGDAVNFEVKPMARGSDFTAIEGCEKPVGRANRCVALAYREEAAEIDGQAVSGDDLEVNHIAVAVVGENQWLSHKYPRGKFAANCDVPDNGGIFRPRSKDVKNATTKCPGIQGPRSQAVRRSTWTYSSIAMTFVPHGGSSLKWRPVGNST